LTPVDEAHFKPNRGPLITQIQCYQGFGNHQASLGESGSLQGKFSKKVKRRKKVLESFSRPEAREKILLMVAKEMNSSYGRMTLRNWHLSKPIIEKIKAQRN